MFQISCEGGDHFRARRSNFHVTEDFSFLKDTTSNVNFITLLCQETYIRAKTKKRSLGEAVAPAAKKLHTANPDVSGTSDHTDVEFIESAEDLSRNFTGNHD